MTDSRVIVGVAQAPVHVVVFDRATHALAWQADGQLDTSTADHVFVTTSAGDWSLLALDTATGTEAWSVHHGWSTQPIGAGRLVVNVGTIGSSTSSASGVDTVTGAALWTRTQPPTVIAGATATTALATRPGCVPGASTDTKTG